MLEVIVATVEEATAAEQAGADRLELVSALSEGGLTPSYGLIRQVLSAVEIPVHVLVRPHSKSFVYSEADQETIITDIDLIRELGAAGIVVGSLTADGRIDEGFLGRVIKQKGELSLTFHRAIDSSRDIHEAAEVLADFIANRKCQARPEHFPVSEQIVVGGKQFGKVGVGKRGDHGPFYLLQLLFNQFLIHAHPHIMPSRLLMSTVGVAGIRKNKQGRFRSDVDHPSALNRKRFLISFSVPLCRAAICSSVIKVNFLGPN